MKTTKTNKAFNARLSAVIHQFDNWSEIAAASGFSVEESKNGNERTLALIKICEKANVNIDWLLFGVGEKYKLPE